MSYRDLFRTQSRLLPFAILLTFLSGFGQTYFISVFAPSFFSEFGVDKALFGAAYSAATLSSAALLPAVGRRLDDVPLRTYTAFVLAGLLVSCALVALAPSFAVLMIGVFGLRFTGQGLLGHVAMTTAGRTEGAFRGRILSIASLGYPLSEALLPLLFLALLGVLDWRWAWGVVMAAVALLAPVILSLPKGIPVPQEPPLARPRGLAESWRRFKSQDVALFRDPRFFLSLPAMLVTPTLLTGLFLYQVPISEAKGWAPEWLPSSFVVFAITRTVFSLVGGPWIDRISALRLFAVHLLPLAAGIAVLAWMSHPAAAWIYLGLAGLTVGFEGPLKSAIWVELYGPRILATIRSWIISLSVFGTALSPPVFGWALENDVPLSLLLQGGATVVVLSAALAYFAVRHPERH